MGIWLKKTREQLLTQSPKVVQKWFSIGIPDYDSKGRIGGRVYGASLAGRNKVRKDVKVVRHIKRGSSVRGSS